MKLSYLIRTAGLPALAAALAVAAAAPAQARDRDHDGGSHASHDRGQDRAAARSNDAPARAPARADFRAQRSEGAPGAGPRSFSRPDPTPVQRTSVPESNARYRSEDTRRGPDAGVRTVTRTAPGQVERRDWNQGNREVVRTEQRNGTYADPRRDRSYGATRTPERTTEARDRDRRDWNDRNRSNGRDWNDRNGNRYNGRDNDHRQWNRDWRNDRRYDWHDYRTSHRNVYHLGRYYSPYRSWSYRPLSIGYYLEPLFFSSQYWIDDPWQYRLPEAYGPYRWIRYYDDALLVDIYSGEVVDVIPDFFW